MKNDPQIKLLFLKFLRKECTPQEIRRIAAYFNDEASAEELQELIRSELSREALREEIMPDPDVFARIEQTLDESPEAERRGLNLPLLLRVAAVLLIIASAIYIWQQRPAPEKSPVIDIVNRPVLEPGGNKAILQIDAGKRVELNSIAEGQTVQFAGVVVSKLSEGRISLDYDHQLVSAADFQPPRHTITTPRGGQYEVRLADGTRVWLNAESSLTFPTAFNGSQRRVHLQGEAYFEVTHDPGQPFYVETRHNEIEVLGTHFNVMEYPDQPFNHTTLLEGSVRFRHGDQKRRLKPGYQARVSSGNTAQIQVAKADLDRVMAWKHGLFLFNKTPLPEVMQDIARWYNADIVYQDPIPEIRFSGMIPRSESIENLLKTIELTGGVRFKIHQNQIMVKPIKRST